MSKFSDGPWKITHSELNGYRISDQSGWGVAVVLKDVNDKENANLIVQAPVMYEALKALLDTRDKTACMVLEAQDKARKALRAAERGE